MELYDTLLGAYSEEHLQAVKREYTDLAERDPGEHWYDSIKLGSGISKKGKKAQSSRFDELALKHFAAYLAKGEKTTDKDTKRRKARLYVDGLLQNGGPSTDVFKKALGDERTELLFYQILFGIK